MTSYDEWVYKQAVGGNLDLRTDHTYAPVFPPFKINTKTRSKMKTVLSLQQKDIKHTHPNLLRLLEDLHSRHIAEDGSNLDCHRLAKEV
jgi:hypothetical protein